MTFSAASLMGVGVGLLGEHDCELAKNMGNKPIEVTILMIEVNRS